MTFIQFSCKERVALADIRRFSSFEWDVDCCIINIDIKWFWHAFKCLFSIWIHIVAWVLTRSICLWIHFHEKREIDFMIRLRQINTNGQDTWSNSWRAKMSHLCGQSISKTSHHEFYKLRDSAVYFVLNGCQHHTFHCNAICCTTTFGWFSSESVV